jgi:catechol 2,3-dioxygenase-like lactoylglutathione lyase family enzyme
MKIKFDMIGLFVSDLHKSVEFYRDVVGLEIDWNGEGAYAEFKHEGIRFSMFERKMLPDLLKQDPSFPSGLNGSFELALNVGEAPNVDSTFESMVAKGAKVVYAPRNEPWKMRSAVICDPDWNLIEIGSDFWE